MEQRTPQEKEGEEGKEEQDESVPAVVAPTTTIPLDLREEFRSAVRSGLLLHLCPPRGQFADLFGIEEVLRWHVLGMLSAKDLAVFGMVRKCFTCVDRFAGDRDGKWCKREKANT